MDCQTEEFLVKSCNLFENSTDDYHRIIYQQLRQKHLDLKQSSSDASDVIDKKVACRRCCSSWASGQYSLRLAPQKRPQRFKQLLRKCSGDFSKLPKDRLFFVGSNFMLLKCFICWQTTKIPLRKPVADSLLKNESKPKEEASSQAKKKKRKRKKDDLAGLNPDAVKRSKLSASSATTTPTSNNASSATFAASTSSATSLSSLYGLAESGRTPPVIKSSTVETTTDDKPTDKKSQQNKRTMKEVNDKTMIPSSRSSTATKRIVPPKSTADLVSQALTQNQKKRKKKSNKLKSTSAKKGAKSAKSPVSEFISSI